MTTQEIAGQAYTKRDCFACGTTGKTRDVTNADKVASGGKTEGAYPRCKGEGFTLHLVTAASAPAVHEPAGGEIPDWMN